MSTQQRALTNRVHIWWERVGEPRPDEDRGWLDAAEQRRAGRFRFARDRARYVGRRRFLRRVLADYLGVTPAMVRYETTSMGRPELDPASSVTFSTSHSDGLAVVAVTGEGLVGIDLERVRPVPDALDMAWTLFTPREYEHLRSTALEERSVAFLRLWTRKEACVKALGRGLSMPLTAIDVLDDQDRVEVVGGASDGTRFVVTDIDVKPGFVGAVAVAGTDVSVELIASHPRSR
jgi:4'-phosphopantetheinyl transferase